MYTYIYVYVYIYIYIYIYRACITCISVEYIVAICRIITGNLDMDVYGLRDYKWKLQSGIVIKVKID
jgi:hypothetical protein